MDNPNSTEPHKTRETPDEESKWHGGDEQRGREAQERSSERGWGTGNSGGQRQQGDGGQRGGDMGNREDGAGLEQGDRRRAEGSSDKAGSGQGSTKN